MAIVTIDGIVKATRTAMKNQGKDDQSVVGQVVIEYPMDSGGVAALTTLLRMLDNPIRCQLTDLQLDLPRTGNLKEALLDIAPKKGSSVESVTLSTGGVSVTLTAADRERLDKVAAAK